MDHIYENVANQNLIFLPHVHKYLSSIFAKSQGLNNHIK
jgi:hypothetical protein